MCQVVLKLLSFSPGSAKIKAQVLIVFMLFATISAVAQLNWKQCVWRRQDYTDNGLIQVDCYSFYS